MAWSDWRAFQSSHMLAGRYDNDSQVLEVQFMNGAIYHYFGVPPTDADSLFQSGSSQDYFNTKIKGRYKYSMMSPGHTKSGRTARRRHN